MMEGVIYFPRAAAYRDFGEIRTIQVRESGRPSRAFPYSERHLQCTWYDPKLRPEALRTHTGEPVTVEHPGQWNLEAGPDFHGAVLLVGTEKRRLCGDAEIHVHPAGWKHHGHQHDPRYNEVLFHISYFPGPLPEEDLPPGTLQIALQEALAANPYFAFEQIDLTAYPYEVEIGLTPLREQCRAWTPEEKMAFLDAAGEERLRRKSIAFTEAAETRGWEQVLYEELMAALGYKNNKAAFRCLAERLPLDLLRTEAESDPEKAYALLLGVSGLMPEDADAWQEPDTRGLIRRGWDFWWKQRIAWEDRMMNPAHWNFAGLRPVNHPRRRLMAAAYLFTEDEPLSTRLLDHAALTPRAWSKKCLQLLEVNTQTYWTRRLALREKQETKPLALIGRGRAISILTNVFVPFLAAQGEPNLMNQGLVDALPSEGMNAIIRQTAHALFGIDHSPSLYRTGLRRQGLIQIFYDYGLGKGGR